MVRKVLHLMDKCFNFTDTHIFHEIFSLKRYERSVLALRFESHPTFENHPSFDRTRILLADEFNDLFPSRPDLPLPPQRCDSFFKYFRSLLSEEKPDILHAQFGNEALFFMPIREMLPIPLVVSFRGSDASQWLHRFPERFARLFELADRLLVRSFFMKKQLIRSGCDGEKITVHHSSIDIDKFTYLPRRIPEQKNFRILTVARFVEKKGVAYSIRAFARFLESYPNSCYTIIGDGNLRPELEALACQLHLQGKVHFLGVQSSDVVQQEIAKAHIFLLTSLTAKNAKQEGIPVALMEALASGLPVVSTHHAGIPEIVIHRKTGILSPEKDVDGISENLCFLAEYPEVWSQFGKQGRKLVEEEFNITTQTPRLENLYDRLLYPHHTI